jgi:hypothetical protein
VSLLLSAQKKIQSRVHSGCAGVLHTTHTGDSRATAALFVMATNDNGRMVPQAVLPEGVREAIDDHLVECAAMVIADIAGQKKISPQYLALAVPGMCHTHAPSKKRKFDCAFCDRRGNCFADPDAEAEQGGTDKQAADDPDKQADLIAVHVGCVLEHLAKQAVLLRRDIEAVIERVKGIVVK